MQDKVTNTLDLALMIKRLTFDDSMGMGAYLRDTLDAVSNNTGETLSREEIAQCLQVWADAVIDEDEKERQ